MKQPFLDRFKPWGDVARLVFFVVGIVAAGALAWASRDNKIADLDRQIQAVKTEVLDVRDEVRDVRARHEDLVTKINADNTQIKADLATLLERTKHMGPGDR